MSLAQRQTKFFFSRKLILRSFFAVLSTGAVGFLAGCASVARDADNVTFYDSAVDDHNRAPASFAPPAFTTDEKGTNLDPLYAHTQADYFFAKGEAQSFEGAHQKAVESFKMVLVYDPDSTQVRLRLSAEYLKMGLLHPAIEQVETALAKDPKYNEAHLMLGGLYSAMKAYDKALGQYQAVLANDPNNTEAPLYIGAVYAEKKDFAQSIHYFESLVHNDNYTTPHLAYYYMGRARVSQGGKRAQKAAEQAFRKALEIKPDHVESVLALSQLYTTLGMDEKSIQVLKTFQTDHGPSARVAEMLAPILLEQEKYDAALEQYQILEQNSDDSLNVQVKIALILIEQKKYPQAIDKLQEILAQAPDSDKIRFYLAAVYEETKDGRHAIEQFSNVPADSQFYSEAIVHATYLLKQQKRSGEAESLAKKALDARGDLPQLYAVYASLLDDKGDFQQAHDVLTAGVTKFPDQAQLRFFLGTVSDRLGDRKAVVEQMKAVIELDPNHVQGLNYLAYTYSEMGEHLEEAEGLAKRALTIEPKDAYVMDTYGWILYKKGQNEASIRILESAYRSQPTEAVIADHLGDAYLRAQMVDRARNMYEHAAEFEADEGKAKAIRSKLTSIQTQMTHSRLPASQDSEK